MKSEFQSRVKDMRYIYLILICSMLFSCDQRITREATFVEEFENFENKIETYKKSVVLVKNQYYYTAQFSNGQNLHFYIDKSGQIKYYKSRKDATSNPRIAYGTGFLISNNGEIATNRHVINPLQSEGIIRKELNSHYFKKIKSSSYQIDSINHLIDRIELILNNKADRAYVSTQRELLVNQLQDLKSDRQTILSFSQYPAFDSDKTIITTERVKLEVVVDNTAMERLDFYNCDVQNESKDYDLDLAIIAIKKDLIKDSFDHFIDLSKTKSYIESSLFDEVFMIGFSLNISAGNNLEQLTPEIRKGKIEKLPSSKRLQYSIASYPGSSGSPIFDFKGNLVAVNFAKTSDNLDLSFGIPAQYLQDLDENQLLSTLHDSTIQRSKEEFTLKPEESNANSEIINSLSRDED